MGVLGWYILTTVATVALITTAAVYSAVESRREEKKTLSVDKFEEVRNVLITTGVWLGIKMAMVWPYILYTHLRTQILEELSEKKDEESKID